MAGLKEIRSRISSVKTTKQVTSAMKMVSAAKLKRAQNNIANAIPFASRLHDLLSHLLSDPDPEVMDSVYLREHNESGKVLIVCLASNKGLCGGFNSSIAKKTILLHDSYTRLAGKDNVELFVIGKQLEKQLKSKEYYAKKTFHSMWDDPEFKEYSNISGKLVNSYVRGEYSKIILVYNHFRNAATQVVQEEQFLPIIPTLKEGKRDYCDYMYEPNESAVLFDIIPYALRTQFYTAVLDSFASEQGARMTAMHKATDNATDLLRQLKLTYNQVRQTSITNEILEITGGAEALK